MNLRKKPLKVGEKVLVFQKALNKTGPRWGPLPVTIVDINKSMVTIERNGVRSARNASQLKRYVVPIDVITPEPVEEGSATASPKTTSGQSPSTASSRPETPTTTGPSVNDPSMAVSLSQPASGNEAPGNTGRAEPTTTATRKPGRPTKAALAAKDKEYQAAEEERARLNPKTHRMSRSSKRWEADSSES